MKQYIKHLKTLSRRTQWLAIGAGLLVVAGGIGLIATRGGEDEPAAETSSLPFVRTQPLQDIGQQATLQKTGVVKPATSGPLVARGGGRITAINAQIGQAVGAGMTIIEIDGQQVANPTRAGATGAAAALNAFDSVKTAALQAADSAVRIAQINLQGAQDNKPLSTEQAAVARELADVSVEKTRLALQDARDLGHDAAIRAADIANKQAQFSQDQATVSRQLTRQQSNLSIEQAQANLQSARASRQRAAADLTSQRVQLQNQLRVAQEQVAAQQVKSPVNGSVARLSVLPGDYVTPGQVVGEVIANEGAYVRLHVTQGIQDQLAIGHTTPIRTSNQSFTGTVAHIASQANSSTGLWQVDIFITSTPQPIQPNQTVTVSLPATTTGANTQFIPLDVLNIRQQGAVVLTLQPDNRVAEHQVTIIGYSGDFAEVESDLQPNDNIIIEGGRSLRAGDLAAI